VSDVAEECRDHARRLRGVEHREHGRPSWLYDGHVIVRAPEAWPESGLFIGIDAVMHQWEQQRDTFDADALEPITDFIDIGDRVAVRQTWRGAGHGPEADLEMAHCHYGESLRARYWLTALPSR
jgi:hypothetical protein